MALVLQKSDSRQALIEFHDQVIDNLKTFSYRQHEFEGELETIANGIKQNFRNSPYKNSIRKALKGARRAIIDAAKNSKQNNKINGDNFFQNYFGGIPLDCVEDAPYDIVIEIEPNVVIGWVFQDKSEDIHNIMNEINCNFNKQCIKVETLYANESEDTHEAIKPIQPVTSDWESSATNFESEFEPESVETEATMPEKEESIKQDYIGRIEFGNKSKMLLQEKREFDKIEGLIKEADAATVTPDDVLVVEPQDQTNRIYAKVVKMEVNKKSTATNFESYTYLGVKVFMRPFLQNQEGRIGRVVPCDLSGYKIRRPSSDELNLLTNVPDNGLPIGTMQIGNESADCFFPFDPDSKTLHDSLYESIFITGIQGSGKTTAIKYLVQAMTTYQNIPSSKRPAVIILDGENSFGNFTKISKMNAEAKQFLQKHGISDITPNEYVLSDDPTIADSTLTLHDIKDTDIPYMLPEMESKTANQLAIIIRQAYENIQRRYEPITIPTLQAEVMHLANNNNLLHRMQIPAINRAITSVELDLFNQTGLIELTSDLLFTPGTVSVINISNLDKTRRRITSLYLLQLLNRFKMEQSNHYPGVMLVIDEAEQLFPRHPSTPEKDYVNRITERFNDITNRGRKRHYGLVIVSHLASEVSPQVVALANTKMAFRSSVSDKWLSQEFGKEDAAEITELPIGTCRLKVMVTKPNQGPINTKIYLPNVQDSE